ASSGKKQASKKITETDAIFDRLAEVKQEAQQDKTILRLSGDAKAVVKIGDFSRGGKSRTIMKAADHDFKPSGKVTPYGILLPDRGIIKSCGLAIAKKTAYPPR
ncbi:hypothetical protein MNBD_CHLOROFLEXI01-4181, partial [hydrothermal vent metagenome]